MRYWYEKYENIIESSEKLQFFIPGARQAKLSDRFLPGDWWHTHISMLSLSEDSMTLRLILSVLIVLLLLLTLTHAYLDPEKDSDGDGLKYDKQYLLLIEFIYISRIKANHIP